jgi:four helix bundle protein
MGDKVQRFTDLEVWRRSHGLFIELVQDIEAMPRKRTAFILADQIARSSGSVGANIAEGFNRSQAKYINCLDIALGEMNETENWFYKLRDVEYLKPERANWHIRECIEIEKMLSGLIRVIQEK